MKLKLIAYWVSTILLGSVLFLFLLKDISHNIFCKKRNDKFLYNYSQSVKKNGAPEKIENDVVLQEKLREMYDTCLQSSDW